MQKKRTAKDKGPGREITELTRICVCVYFASGDSIKDICETLHRTTRTVNRILTECGRNGMFERYVDKSPICDYRTARRRMEEFLGKRGYGK